MNDNLLEGLTEAQRRAVDSLEGPVLVLAGPGSGKTTVVTRRVANLVANGIPAWSILALTFTNKAAAEMRERIELLLPADVPGRRGLTVSTFHAFCARMLRRYAADAGISGRFTIYDTADQRDALKRAITAAELGSHNWTPQSVGARISNAKNRLLTAEEFSREADDFVTKSVARAYREYERILHGSDALDFDDLLLIMARLLREESVVRQELQTRYQYVLIDEYQDTNHAQFVIAHGLAAAHRNIFVVGDADQSVYGWRGADIANILEFEEHYPSASVIQLGQNFRSTAHIVATAAGLIEHNRRRHAKELFTELGEGEKPELCVAQDEHQEAALIARTLRHRHEELDLPWREMVILYRINALSRVLEEELRRASVPYVIARGTAFYERKEVKDALAYLRVAMNPGDEISLRRVVNTPARGIGKTTLERLEVEAINRGTGLFDMMAGAATVNGLTTRAVNAVGSFVVLVDGWRALLGEPLAADEDPRAALAELVERVVRDSGLEAALRRSKLVEDEERLANLEELISAASEFEPVLDMDAEGPPSGEDRIRAAYESERSSESTDTGRTLFDRLAAFLESIALVSDADAIDAGAGAVTLMTLHTAKGLEYDFVIIAGMEEGILPLARSTQDEQELEEERRLCYVGITRARRFLLLTRAAVRTVRGLRERRLPSSFLRELPEEHVVRDDPVEYDVERVGGWDDHEAVGGWTSGKTGGLVVGCLVRHERFGLGRIEAITPRPRGSAARVLFEHYGRKTLIVEYAKLERVNPGDVW